MTDDERLDRLRQEAERLDAEMLAYLIAQAMDEAPFRDLAVVSHFIRPASS